MPTLAAIDVGSNAIRLSTARVSPVGALVDTDFHRYAVRLGADVFACGRVQAERAAALLGVFEDIAAQMQRRGVERYRAVATSAMREAKNAPEVLRRIRGSFEIVNFIGPDMMFEHDADGLPVPQPERLEVKFLVLVPKSAETADPGTFSVLVYGHGLMDSPEWPLGDDRDSDRVQQLADEMRWIVIGTEWRGLCNEPSLGWNEDEVDAATAERAAELRALVTDLADWHQRRLHQTVRQRRGQEGATVASDLFASEMATFSDMRIQSGHQNTRMVYAEAALQIMLQRANHLLQ